MKEGCQTLKILLEGNREDETKRPTYAAVHEGQSSAQPPGTFLSSPPWLFPPGFATVSSAFQSQGLS